MRTRRQTPEQQAVISRRLASLSAELTASSLAPSASTKQPEAPDPSAWVTVDPELAAAFQPPEMAPWSLPAELPPSSATRFSVPTAPGRHAARRRGRFPQLPRLAFGSAQVSVVAVAIAVGLVATAWWAIQSRPEPTSPPATSLNDVSPSSSALLALTPSDEAPEELVVDVSGKVRRPGIAVLSPGARVIDALKAAGGVRRGVELGALNLARPLVDGEQILVGVSQPAGVGAAAAAPPSGSATTPGALVNLNTAGQVELETLPGVGPVTALAIMSWRTENNGFGAIEELLDVQGIGEATLAQLAPHVTV